MKKKFVSLNTIQRILFYPFRWLLIHFLPIAYLKLQYRFITGHTLHLNEPKRYTEKLQYLRWFTYPHDKRVIEAADRIGLREYAARLNLSQYLVPIQGMYERVEDIPFKTLQTPYVIKATHGSNMNFFVNHSSKLNLPLLKKRINHWLRKDYGKMTLEPHYSRIQPRILIENFISNNQAFPIEYKLHVFHGVVKFLYVVTNRGGDIRYTLFDRDWLPFDGAQFNGWKKSDEPIHQPLQFEKMVSIAETLAQPFPFVRVDLYNVLDKIYISEMTFTPAKGTLKLDNDSFDIMIGSWLHVHEKN